MGVSDRRMLKQSSGPPGSDPSRLRRAALMRRREAPTTRDRTAAATAWSYFCAYGNKETGLAPSRAGGHAVTLADIGRQILGVLAAQSLALAGEAEARTRLIRITGALTEIPLGPRRLPLRLYRADTMTAATRDPGWSAPDVLTLAGALLSLQHVHADFRPVTAGLLKGWNLKALIRDGRLVGATAGPNGRREEMLLYHQGRIGTEQAAAQVATMLGLPAEAAAQFGPISTTAPGSDHSAPIDIRGPGPLDPIHHSVPDPTLWSALQFGWNREGLVHAAALLSVARQRFQRLGAPTGYGLYAVDRAPGWISSAPGLSSDRIDLRAPDGRAMRDVAALATGTAFAWEALFATPYARHLRAIAAEAHRSDGFAPAMCERTGRPINTATAYTNALVLASLSYRAHGPVGPVAG